MVRSETAVVHYKSRFEHTAVRYWLGDAAQGEYECTSNLRHESPVHPDWVVFTVDFDASGGVAFLPLDGRAGGAYNPDGGPAPKFAAADWACKGRYRLRRGGTYVLADGELTRWGPHDVRRDAFGACVPRAARRARLALFVDIDGTLKGEGKLAHFVRAWERTLALDGALLVFNTGRSVPSVQHYLSDIERAVVPTAVISRVGTEIYWFRGEDGWWKEWRHDAQWAQKLDGLAGWQWQTVLDRVKQPLESHTRVKARLCTPVTRNDPPLWYVTYIITFVIRRVYAGEAVRVVREALGDLGAKLCVSGAGVDEQYLDLVNVGAGKLGGLRYVAQRLGVEPKQCVMCGDSGNDLDAIRHDGEELAIIVGNAEVELRRYWDELCRDGEQKRVFMAKKHCAAGILEGLEKFGFL